MEGSLGREKNQASLPGGDGNNVKSWKANQDREVEGDKITCTEVFLYTE